ncbi:hypothetical protein D187_006940 [Cystobacter fuscus DSM 2262]|uniref:Uncharacterized protein n=1 Tax=Cystobacter fuscus (strain ATCC 25194 / DSM 2262 / NBRC 100088 / M29) TaxID=1242864 RepID=S9P243_CYSF2|nr:hypothetical protein [Cystobacter fuscus]EPX57186.1 hypothetical protein D187_006940 [Cystobacter fuscus DSM 2262]
MIVAVLALVMAQTPEPCLERYRALQPICPGAASCPSNEQEACARLSSTFAVDESRLGLRLQEDEAVEVVNREAIQPVLGAGLAGTPGQIDAPAQVQTVGLAGASLGIVATPSNRVGLFSFSVNPLAIASQGRGSFVRLSRLFDVSVVLPALFMELPRDAFLGLRANLDFVGAARAHREFETLSATLLQASRQVFTTEGWFREDLRRALDTLTPEQRARCLDALFTTPVTLDGLAACSPELPARLLAAASARAPYQKALAGYQDALDSSHGGLNVQLDVPATRSSTVPFRAALLGAGTFGLVGDARAPWRIDAMASLGPDCLLPPGDSALGLSLAAALAVKARLPRGLPRLHSSLGLRGHLGQDSQVRVLSLASRPGNYLQAQWGASLPLGRSGVAVSGGVNWTLVGRQSGEVALAMNLLYSLPGGER